MSWSSNSFKLGPVGIVVGYILPMPLPGFAIQRHQTFRQEYENWRENRTRARVRASATGEQGESSLG